MLRSLLSASFTLLFCRNDYLSVKGRAMSSEALVIIPTYNEAENIELLLVRVFSLGEDFHVLVVDDNSPDGTADLVLRLQDKYSGRLYLQRRPTKQGICSAYVQGFRYALAKEYNYVLQMDADFSHNPVDLPRLYEVCAKEKYDIAIGSRYVKGVNVINWPIGRVVLSYCASLYVRLVTGLPVYDATAGFVCYRSSVLSALDFSKIKFVGYAFQIGIKHRIWKHGGRMKEVSIVFTDRIRGCSKMSLSIFREAFWSVLLLALQGITEKYPPIPTTNESFQSKRADA